MINMIIWCFLFDQICQIQLEVSCLGSWFTILTGFPLGKFFQTQPICLTMNSWLPRISKAMRVTVKRAMVALRCLISFHHHHQSHKNPMEPGRVLWFPTATMRSFVYSFRICLADIGRFVSNFRFPWIVCESSVYVQHRQLSFELSHPEKPISSAMEKTHLFFCWSSHFLLETCGIFLPRSEEMTFRIPQMKKRTSWEFSVGFRCALCDVARRAFVYRSWFMGETKTHEKKATCLLASYPQEVPIITTQSQKKHTIKLQLHVFLLVEFDRILFSHHQNPGISQPPRSTGPCATRRVCTRGSQKGSSQTRREGGGAPGNGGNWLFPNLVGKLQVWKIGGRPIRSFFWDGFMLMIDNDCWLLQKGFFFFCAFRDSEKTAWCMHHPRCDKRDMTSPNYGLVCRKIQVNILGFWRSQTFNIYAIFQQENATKHQPLGPKECPPRNEDALERERKETAKRTLELMEARRMVEVAMEGENAKKCLGPMIFFSHGFFWVTNCPKWLCLFCGVSSQE